MWSNLFLLQAWEKRSDSVGITGGVTLQSLAQLGKVRLRDLDLGATVLAGTGLAQHGNDTTFALWLWARDDLRSCLSRHLLLLFRVKDC